MVLRNPGWSRDELILALDLYNRLEGRIPSPSDHNVIELSGVLRSLPIHPYRPDPVKFRNVNGVAMKLANFRAVDPSNSLRGLDHGGKAKKEIAIWNEFADEPEELASIASLIASNASSVSYAGEDDGSVAIEGRVMTWVHRSRERSRRIVELKKASVLRNRGVLCCEACEFDFSSVYGQVGEGYIECHHIVPLSELRPGRRTRLDDLVVLCSNCHRMIHRKRPWLTVEALKMSIVIAKGE